MYERALPELLQPSYESEMPHRALSIGKVIVRYEEALKWLDAVRIPWRGTRAEELRDYLHQEVLRTDSDVAKAVESGIVSPDLYDALNDAHVIASIAEQLGQLRSNLVPRRTIRDALQGPLFTSDEDETNNQARNKLVELELASYVSEAGLRLLGFDDLRFSFEGTSYLVECKRPLKGATLSQNVEHAAGQLSRKLPASEGRGLIGVAVDRVLELQGQTFRVDSAEALDEPGRRLGVKFRDLIQQEVAWPMEDRRIVGILGIVRPLLYVPKERTVVPSYTLAIIILASDLLVLDTKRLERLARRLRST